MAYLTAIAAMAPNRAIGLNGALPWHMPEDLAFFKRTTRGHAVVMGRRTFESLGRPLPGRRNIVMTRDAGWQVEGIETIHSPNELDSLSNLDDEVFVIGGAEVFAALTPRIERWIISHIFGSHHGDVFMPVFEESFPKVEVLETHRDFEVRSYTK
jgi:dihydrofolate reductase